MSIDRMGGEHIINKGNLQKLVMRKYCEKRNDFRIKYRELLRTLEVISRHHSSILSH